MQFVNLKMLAEKLNLSVSTVSKAFRNSYDISQETRERILTLAKELNYQPNPIASSLRTNRSRTIAVIIPEIANNFFTLAINGIESIARDEGYHVLIYLTHEDHEKEVAFTQLVQNGRVDGILMSLSQGANDYSHIEDAIAKKIPLVFFDRVFASKDTSLVTTNDYESGYLATKHLLDLGCQRVAHLCFSGSPSVGVKRMQGYVQALKDHDIPVEEDLIVRCVDNNEKDTVRIIDLLQKEKRPTAIFSSLERMAIASYHACAALKLSIPGDIKIISFSNLETAALLNPSLTTITQPAYEIGHTAASLLFKELRKNNKRLPEKEHIVLNSTLIQRRSTMPE
jgi:LacI family transcriptional regulator